MPIDLRSLVISQSNIRNYEQIAEMVEFVQSGGIFNLASMKRWSQSHHETTKPPLISVTVFPDNVKMLHDGHHRAIACAIAGRWILQDDEYFAKAYTYEQYLEINVKEGWLTPFDPREEVRLGNFGTFKSKAKEIMLKDEKKGTQFICENANEYKEKRVINSVIDLAKSLSFAVFERRKEKLSV